MWAITVIVAVMAVNRGLTSNKAAFAVLTLLTLIAIPSPFRDMFLLMGERHIATLLMSLLSVTLLANDSPSDDMVAFALLVLAIVGDPLAIVISVIPICVAGYLHKRPEYIVIAIGSAVSAWLIETGIGYAGGYTTVPLVSAFASLASMGNNISVLLQGILGLFGADVWGMPLSVLAMETAVHLIGFGVALFAVYAWLRKPTKERNFFFDAIAIGAVVNVAAFLFSNQPGDIWTSRYMVPAFIFSSIIAARWLGDRVVFNWRHAAVPALVLLAYLVSPIGTVSAKPSPNEPVVSWLERHHLHYGYGAYWDANVTTVESAGRVRVVSVILSGDKLVAYHWLTESSWYADGQRAHFLLFGPGEWAGVDTTSAIATWGRPSISANVSGYTVLVWDKDINAQW